MTAAIPASDIAAAGTAQVTAINPGSAASNALPFTVSNPSPPPGPTYTLSVTRTGTAASRGTVTSRPGGISCGSICNASFASATLVTLTVTVSGNGVFAGWGGTGAGACAGKTATTCNVTMDAAKNVTATINRR